MKRQIFLCTLMISGISFGFAQPAATSVFASYQQQVVPSAVIYEINNRYHGYEWEHVVQREKSFDAVLRKGDVFISVSIGNEGRVYREVYHTRNPVRNHVCHDHCHRPERRRHYEEKHHHGRDKHHHHHHGKGKGHHKKHHHH